MRQIKEFSIIAAILFALAFAVCGCNEAVIQPKVWGNGELPADYVQMFGNSNADRLNWNQNDRINKHEVLLRGLNGKKDGKQVHQNGVIDILMNLQGRVEKLEAVDPNDMIPMLDVSLPYTSSLKHKQVAGELRSIKMKLNHIIDRINK